MHSEGLMCNVYTTDVSLFKHCFEVLLITDSSKLEGISISPSMHQISFDITCNISFFSWHNT
jgi:hypothetical protein